MIENGYVTVGWLWQVLIGAALFTFPGYAAISILRPRIDFGPVEELCLAVGLSIGIIPLALYISTLMGLTLTPAWAAGLLLAAALVASGRLRRRWLEWRARETGRLPTTAIALGLIFLGSLVARLLAVKGIVYPLWTDSYHHTMIAQIIVDTGRVPSSYEPYAPIHDFTYHFGFHALVAWFHWLTGVPVPRSVAVVGQVVNALVVPTTYLIGWRLFRDRKVGLVSALVTGLLSQMPALFVNWGRYPQLSGQILLPVVAVLTVEALDRREFDPRVGVLAGLGAAGLFLTHNRVTLFFGVFVVLYALLTFIAAPSEMRSRKTLLLGAACLTVTALIVDAPWIWRFFHGFGGDVVRQQLESYQPQGHGAYFDWELRQFVDHGARLDLWILAGAGAVWGIVRREKSVWLLVLWTICLLGAANLNLIGITPLFSTLIVIIWLYLPVSLLTGYFIVRLYVFVTRRVTNDARMPLIVQWLTLIALCLVIIGQAVYITRLTEPQNGFVRPADLEAMRWIAQNVPADALFDIKAFFWTPLVAHGLDAGYWLPLLVRRETIIPPEPYAGDGTPNYIAYVNSRIRALNDLSDPIQLWRAMNVYGVTHIYIGSRSTDWDPRFFLQDPEHFTLLYSEEDVWIFEVVG